VRGISLVHASGAQGIPGPGGGSGDVPQRYNLDAVYLALGQSARKPTVFFGTMAGTLPIPEYYAAENMTTDRRKRSADRWNPVVESAGR